MTPLPPVGAEPLMPSRRWRRRLASVEAAAIAGILCAVGWSVALWGLLSPLSLDASAEQIDRYFASPDAGRHTLLFLQILVFATMAFLWFVGVVRGRLGDAEPKLFGTAFFGGAILLGGTLLVGASALAAPSLLAEVGRPTPEPGAVAMSRAMAVILLTVMAPRAATLVIFSTAALGRATGALPTWLVWLSYAIGTIEFINVTLTTPTIYVFPAWIALVSVDLLIRRTTRDDAASPVVAPG